MEINCSISVNLQTYIDGLMFIQRGALKFKNIKNSRRFKIATVNYEFYFMQFLRFGKFNIFQTSHIDRMLPKGVHSSLKIFKMASISK